MLDHDHGPVSKGRIPSNLLEMYVRYKQDIRAIVSWLMSHGSRRFKELKTVSIRDLVSLAAVVQKKTVVMPDTIDFCFREAIAARAQLTKFFRRESGQGDQEDQETDNHEFFTESLRQIYSGLCKCCARSEDECKKRQVECCGGDGNMSPPNRFAALNNRHDVQDRPSVELPSDDRRAHHPDIDKKSISVVKTEPQLVNDPLSDVFEVTKLLQEIDDLLSTTTNVWEQAAQGRNSIVVAAFVTNSALAIFEEIEARLTVLSTDFNSQTLRTKFLQARTERVSNADPQCHTDVVHLPYEILLHYADRHRSGQVRPRDAKSAQITVRNGPHSESMDRECYLTMLQDLGQHIVHGRRTTVLLNGSPLYADIGYFLQHKDDDVHDLRCCYGLQALLRAYKGHLFAPECAHVAPSSCRLQALRFAQEITKSIIPVLADASMPCRCCQTLAFHVENFKIDLQVFTSELLFNLYFQNPWVCGSHILEMMENAFYYGLRLFSYRHFVGSVLHVYNILRELTAFQEIPLLERLCDTFNEILFPGGRPSKNFRFCCMRYMGGRLRFNDHAADHKSGCHKFEIPVSSAKATAGFGLRKEANDSRFQYRKISLLHHIKDKGYHLDDASWDRVHHLNDDNENHKAAKTKKRRSCHHTHPSQCGPFSSLPQHQLCQLQKAVLTEFTGPFPVAKINFFEIYISCVRIVSMISNGAHGDEDQGSRCLCFLETMVTAADRYKDNEHKLQPFGNKKLVETCVQAIVTVLGDRGLEDFLWKGV